MLLLLPEIFQYQLCPIFAIYIYFLLGQLILLPTNIIYLLIVIPYKFNSNCKIIFIIKSIVLNEFKEFGIL